MARGNLFTSIVLIFLVSGHALRVSGPKNDTASGFLTDATLDKNPVNDPKANTPPTPPSFIGTFKVSGLDQISNIQTPSATEFIFAGSKTGSDTETFLFDLEVSSADATLSSRTLPTKSSVNFIAGPITVNKIPMNVAFATSGGADFIWLIDTTSSTVVAAWSYTVQPPIVEGSVEEEEIIFLDVIKVEVSGDSSVVCFTQEPVLIFNLSFSYDATNKTYSISKTYSMTLDYDVPSIIHSDGANAHMVFMVDSQETLAAVDITDALSQPSFWLIESMAEEGIHLQSLNTQLITTGGDLWNVGWATYNDGFPGDGTNNFTIATQIQFNPQGPPSVMTYFFMVDEQEKGTNTVECNGSLLIMAAGNLYLLTVDGKLSWSTKLSSPWMSFITPETATCTDDNISLLMLTYGSLGYVVININPTTGDLQDTGNGWVQQIAISKPKIYSESRTTKVYDPSHSFESATMNISEVAKGDLPTIADSVALTYSALDGSVPYPDVQMLVAVPNTQTSDVKVEIPSTLFGATGLDKFTFTMGESSSDLSVATPTKVGDPYYIEGSAPTISSGDYSSQSLQISPNDTPALRFNLPFIVYNSPNYSPFANIVGTYGKFQSLTPVGTKGETAFSVISEDGNNSSLKVGRIGISGELIWGAEFQFQQNEICEFYQNSYTFESGFIVCDETFYPVALYSSTEFTLTKVGFECHKFLFTENQTICVSLPTLVALDQFTNRIKFSESLDVSTAISSSWKFLDALVSSSGDIYVVAQDQAGDTLKFFVTVVDPSSLAYKSSFIVETKSLNNSDSSLSVAMSEDSIWFGGYAIPTATIDGDTQVILYQVALATPDKMNVLEVTLGLTTSAPLTISSSPETTKIYVSTGSYLTCLSNDAQTVQWVTEAELQGDVSCTIRSVVPHSQFSMVSAECQNSSHTAVALASVSSTGATVTGGSFALGLRQNSVVSVKSVQAGVSTVNFPVQTKAATVTASPSVTSTIYPIYADFGLDSVNSTPISESTYAPSVDITLNCNGEFGDEVNMYTWTIKDFGESYVGRCQFTSTSDLPSYASTYSSYPTDSLQMSFCPTVKKTTGSFNMVISCATLWETTKMVPIKVDVTGSNPFPTPPGSGNHDHHDKKMNPTVIAGIVMIVVGAAMAVGALFYVWYESRRKAQHQEDLLLARSRNLNI